MKRRVPERHSIHPIKKGDCKKMEIKIFNEYYIEEATHLAMKQYQEESHIMKVLPQENYAERIKDLLSKMINKDLGFVAIKGKELVGYMTGYGPITDFFGTSKGIFFLPIHGHGALQEDRSRIYSKLYQHAAKNWVDQGLLSHALAIYSHDQVTLNSFFRNGFGLRCVDAIMDINHPELLFHPHDLVTCREINMDELHHILPLENNLRTHLHSSPIFMPHQKYNLQELKKEVEHKKVKIICSKYA